MKNDLHNVDVEEFLASLDIKNIKSDDREVKYSCPFPGHRFGDKNPSASMNKESTAFFCFGCGEKGNAITFLSYVKDVSKVQAAKWIAEKWMPEIVEIENLYDYVLSIIEGKKEENEFAAEPIDISSMLVDWEAANE